MIYKEPKHYNKNRTQYVINCQKGQKQFFIFRQIQTIKYNSIYKAYLVYHSFNQIKNINFYKLYAIVLKPISFKVFIAIITKNRQPFYYINIITIFLNIKIKESIFIKLFKKEYKCFFKKIELFLYNINSLKQTFYKQYLFL